MINTNTNTDLQHKKCDSKNQAVNQKYRKGRNNKKLKSGKERPKTNWNSYHWTRLVEKYYGKKTNHDKSREPAQRRLACNVATVAGGAGRPTAAGTARLLSHTQVVPLLRTHSVPPTHDLPLKLPHVSQVFLQQLANPHFIQAGWVWDEGETVDVCIHGQSFNGVQVKGESGWGGSWGSRHSNNPLS